MDLIAILREKIDALEKGEYSPGLHAVLLHVETADRHLARGRKDADETAFTDSIYRTNQAFEGSIKEAYRVLAGKDPDRMTPFDIETYLDRNNIFRARVLKQFTNYRTEWRNPSTHDYKLDFDENEAFLWPVIVIILLFSFRSSIRELIETAKSRKFTVKVAGNELTMDEISEQQRTLIADLQKQLGELQEKVDSLIKVPLSTREMEKPKLAEERIETARLILWVDDNPKNNSFLIQGIQDQGVQVVTALSTREGREKFRSAKFDRVITDMGRYEDGRFNPIAGLELTKTIRDIDTKTPIFIYTSSRGMQEETAAFEAGATGVTTSPTTLLNMLQLGTGQKKAT